MRAYTLILLGGLSFAATLANAGEKPEVPSGKEIRALVEQLASQNPPPITGDQEKSVAPDYRLPAGFDRARQKLVHEARLRLKQIGPAAFPYLIERWGDKRYCVTTSHGLSGYCHNESVGSICQAIVFDQLQPYSYWPETDDDPRGKPKRPSYPNKFLDSAEAAKKWCEARRDKSLYELQLEILDWVIQAEGARPRDYTDAEREALQSIRRDLIKAKKPILRGNYDQTDIEV